MNWSTKLLIVSGVLALGGFVGHLMRFATLNLKPTTKVIVTLLSAALGGAPILFLQDAGTARWFYPLGLLLAFLIPYEVAHADRGASEIAEYASRPGRARKIIAAYAIGKAIVHGLLLLGILALVIIYVGGE